MQRRQPNHEPAQRATIHLGRPDPQKPSKNHLPGQRINIIAGVAVSGNVIFNHQLSDGFKTPIDQVVANIDPESCFFGPFPILAPCQNWTALVEAFFARYTVNGRPPSFAAAAAMQVHSPKAEAIRNIIASRLEIKVEDANDQADRGFILVRIPRQVPQNTVCLSTPEYQPLWNSVLSDCRSAIDGLKAHPQLYFS